MKYIKLYEKFEDFDETWIDEPFIDDRIKKHKLPKILYDFLEGEDILEQFINNFEKQHSNISYFEWFHLTELDVHFFTDSCFCWSTTPEGHMFWSKIKEKWISYIKKLNINFNKKISEFVLYEKFLDFEEVWDEYEDYSNYDDVNSGDIILILPSLSEYIEKHKWTSIMLSFIGKEYKILLKSKDFNIDGYIIDVPNRKEVRWFIPHDCAKKVTK